MSSVSNVSVHSFKKSKFFKPSAIHFIRNGSKSKWDFVECPNCVAVIVFNITRNTLLCVKQFRPTAYIQQIPKGEWKNINTQKYPTHMGTSMEFCAGIVDNERPLADIAKDEILQEMGYDVPVERLKKVKTLRSKGIALYDVHMYYTEVEDIMEG